MKFCTRCKIEDGPFATIHNHHINGVHNDNRPENKLPLCANCHETLHLERWDLSDISLPSVKLPPKYTKGRPPIKTGMKISTLIKTHRLENLSPLERMLVLIKSEIYIERDDLASIKIENIGIKSISYVEVKTKNTVIKSISDALFMEFQHYIKNHTSDGQKYLFSPLQKTHHSGHMSGKSIFNILKNLSRSVSQ
jgi:hypothetical protein